MPQPHASIDADHLLPDTWTGPSVDVPYLLSVLLASGAVLLVGVVYLLVLLTALLAVPGAIVLACVFKAHLHPFVIPAVIAAGVLMLPLFLSVAFGLAKAALPPGGERGEEYTLSAKEEPVLWATVQRLCRLLGSPVPKRIVVLAEPNAFANTGSILRALLGFPNMALGIGMPIVGAMTVREFLGILAHETGHLRQRVSGIVGLAAASMLRRLDFAAHGVTQREWDLETFDEYADTPLLEIVLVRLGRAGAAIARGICRALLAIAHAAWSFARRRQEINADAYEVRLAGSAAFESASRTMHALELAYSRSLDDLERMLKKSCAPDDVPAVTLDHLRLMGAEGRAMGDRNLASGEADWLDSYPAERERVQRARDAKEPGVISLDAPATVLFQNFHRACERATHALLETIVDNHEAKLERRVSREELREGLVEQLEGRRALAALLGFEHLAWRPVLPAILELSEPTDPRATLARLRTARRARPGPATLAAADRFRDANERWMACLAARQAFELAPSTTVEVRGIGKVSRWTVVSHIDKASADLAQAMDAVDPLVEAAEVRVACALRLLCVKGAEKMLPDAARHKDRVRELLKHAGVLREAFPIVRRLRETTATSAALASATHNEKLRKSAWERALPLTVGMGEHLGEIRRLGREVPAPGQTTIKATGDFGEWLAGPPTGPEAFFAVHDAAEGLMDRFRRAHEQSVGELARITLEVERALDAAAAARQGTS
ncbi:hypothetical protein PHYC_03007 [Phycisphaerales bacterium]|nr:hypothetical protein PHYC_03007 [Phycisphaerales bacterium]